MGVCEWVNGLAERLELMRDCAALKLGKSRESRLRYVNRGSKLRELEVGSLVLYRVPGMKACGLLGGTVQGAGEERCC